MTQGFASTDRQNVARVFALVFGIGYLIAGIIGFAATGINGFVSNGNDSLLGFDLNVFHNIVHFTIGGGLIVASRLRDVSITQGVLIGVGLFYTLATLLGFLNYLQIISINGATAADNFLHLFSGASALIFGLLGTRQSGDAERDTAVTAGAVVGRDGEQRSFEDRRALWDTDETYREEAY